MKISALIHKSALHFILERTKVKEILGPIDSNPNYSTSSIEMKILNDQSYPIIVECFFKYHRINETISNPPIVRVIINWLPQLEFSLKDVEIINN